MLAACLDASDEVMLDEIQTKIQQEMPKLQVEKLEISKTNASSMSATVVRVIFKEEHSDTTKVSLEQIRSMLATAKSIPDCVSDQVQEVFIELVKAENVVHDRAQEEEGSDFSVVCIVEVVATLLALHLLHVKTVSCGPLPLGEGSMWTNEKGLLPIPSPLTLQLLIGMTMCPGPIMSEGVELITPTAAALLRVLTNASNENGVTTRRPSCFTTRSIGVGVDGSKTRVLRLLLGEAANENEASVPSGNAVQGSDTRVVNCQSTTQHPETNVLWKIDQLTQLEANLDDMTAEALAFAVQLLLENGACDAWIVPIVMKKGRAAHTLSCLCHSKDTNCLLEVMFRHTTALGVRIFRGIERAALRRSFLSVQTPFSEDDTINVKVGYLGEEVVSVKAEFDDCARISREQNVPIKLVVDSATQQAHSHLATL